MRSVPELSSEANNYEFSTNVSFRSWVHVSRTILKQAEIYKLERQIEDSYVLYLRYADLVLNKLSVHPGLAKAKASYDSLVSHVRTVIDSAEALKAQLNARPKPVKRRVSGTIQHDPNVVQSGARPNADAGGNDHPIYERAEPLQASPPSTSLDDDYLKILSSFRKKSPHHSPGPAASSHTGHDNLAKYPVVPTYHAPQPSLSFNSPYRGLDQDRVGNFAPARNDTKPPLPPKPVKEYEHKSVYTTEGGAPLRTLYLPSKLRDEFLRIAEPNTRKNLETAGILCGKLNRNAFFITHLVIPHQESTSDTCSTTNEEALFEFVESKDLFILGWIHTHPTQSCFMSSVDLHTQSAYQIMLPEAVAVVCSPQSSPSWGAFRLTDPTGVDIIKKCGRSGFHPHEEPDLYRHALPGHMRLYDYQFDSADLRKNPM